MQPSNKDRISNPAITATGKAAAAIASLLLNTQLCTGFLIDHARVEKKYWKLLNEFQIQVYQESVEARPFDNYQKAWEYYTGEL